MGYGFFYNFVDPFKISPTPKIALVTAKPLAPCTL